MPSQIPAPVTAVITPAQPAAALPTFKPNAQLHAQPSPITLDVSPHNPCPFLRGLVGQGLLPDDQASLQQVTDAIHHIQSGQDSDAQGDRKPLPSQGIKLIAMTANGLSPAQVLHNAKHGVSLKALRGGPFDKKGVGSRILSPAGQYDAAELERLTTFATPKTALTGETELGLNSQQIQTMLDANAERAKHQKRLLDRMIMNGEFPVLLQVLGKQGYNETGNVERYLAVCDVQRLFEHRQFPERIAKRIGLNQR